jgi:hypothetical protein
MRSRAATVRSVTSVARTAVAIGLLVTLIAGCSTTKSGHRTPTSPTPSDPAAQAVASVWVPVVDTRTKIQFGMPTDPETVDEFPSSDGGPPVRRTKYHVLLAPFLEITVYVDSGERQPVDFEGPDAYAQRLAAATRAAGNTGVQILDRQATTVQGHPALDFRLAYTPKPPKQGKPILLTRFVQARHAVVTMQTFAAVDTVAPLIELRTLQAKLVAGLTLPVD